MINHIIYVLKSIKHRKLRSWLTMIGIFMGIAAIVSLIALGAGLQNYIDESMGLLGTDKIIISPKGNLGVAGLGLGGAKLTQKDIDYLRNMPEVKDISYMALGTLKMEYNNEVRYITAIGMPLNRDYNLLAQMLAPYGIKEGRDLTQGDNKKITIGINYHEKNIFSRLININDKVKLNEENFKVVGIWNRVGNGEDDKNVYLSIDTLRNILGKSDEVDQIYLQIPSSNDLDLAAENINKRLANFRNVKIGEEDFTVQTPEQLLSSFNNIFLIVQIVLIGIASISLFVGGIGIMNTMYTAVLERTKEIGIMKAIGATNKDITLIFLIESGLLGLLGGLIGLLIGVSIAKGIEYLAFNIYGQFYIRASFSIFLIIGSLAFSFIVGMLSGLLPAYRASKLQPVDTLRYE